jgi:hypothetical protein
VPAGIIDLKKEARAMGTVLLVAAILPLFVLLDWIRRRARRANVRPLWYVAGAFTGWAVAVTLALWAAPHLFKSLGGAFGLPDGGYGIGWILLGWIAGCVGVGMSYIVLRIRTAHDPDYEELTEPAKPSLEADVLKPRDGDHVGPD